MLERKTSLGEVRETLGKGENFKMDFGRRASGLYVQTWTCKIFVIDAIASDLLPYAFLYIFIAFKNIYLL